MKKEHIEFIDTYLKKGYNATTAYMKVYPDCTYESARALSSKLLTNVNVKELIDEKKAEMMDELGIDMITQLKQLEYIKSKLIEDGKLKDAVTPLEVQNKMLGLYASEKQEITHNVIPPLFPDIKYDDSKEDDDIDMDFET